ncbi:MAG: hypothetical protein ACRD6R_08970 [Candidatus Polarisedimenticolia bacterium]
MTGAARRALRLAALLPAAAALAAGCAGLERNPDVVGAYSDKLSPYNYKEEGAVARFVVGVDGARFIRDEPYFPLFVQVANRTHDTFEITRESFLLEDSLGRQYALAPARELSERYHRIDIDRRLFRQNRQFTAVGVDLFTRVDSDFFPSTARRTILIDQVSLPPRTYMEDVLYFPVPEGGLNGVPLRLVFAVRGLADPIVAVFEVPRTLGILEKRRERDAQEPRP